ncbi:MAG TPA: histidinol-phosphate transaminase [Actinomycetota bacterium]|nr:histidinol-phosphate transaminase [Actinomycetota bacterium]
MLPLRPDLEDVEPYVSPQLPARVRLNTNESPYAPPRTLTDALLREVEGMSLNRYPDRDARRLVDALAAKWDWPAEGIWVANGSNEVFMHLFLAYGGPGRTSLTFEPTYSLHSLIPRLALTEVAQLPRDDSFAVDVAAASDWIEENRPAVAIVCSPNNPTGNSTPLDVVAALCDAAPGLVVVDEAYGEFAPDGTSAIALLREHDNLVVVRTFSKAWRLAGVRIGYLLGAPELVSAMAVARLPYHLSTLSQAVGIAALEAEDETLEAVGEIVAERDRIAAGLADLGLRVMPSDASFVLFEVPDTAATWRALYERGVLVRSYERSAVLGSFLRVTVGLSDENDDFLRTLEEVMA